MGVPAFELLRHRGNDQDIVLIAFDLLELDGDDLRREPLEVRKETLASLLRGSPPGVQPASRASRRRRVRARLEDGA
jgi:ATP-dependent DNA ligase